MECESQSTKGARTGIHILARVRSGRVRCRVSLELRGNVLAGLVRAYIYFLPSCWESAGPGWEGEGSRAYKGQEIEQPDRDHDVDLGCDIIEEPAASNLGPTFRRKFVERILRLLMKQLLNFFAWKCLY